MSRRFWYGIVAGIVYLLTTQEVERFFLGGICL